MVRYPWTNQNPTVDRDVIVTHDHCLLDASPTNLESEPFGNQTCFGCAVAGHPYDLPTADPGRSAEIAFDSAVPFAEAPWS